MMSIPKCQEEFVTRLSAMLLLIGLHERSREVADYFDGKASRRVRVLIEDAYEDIKDLAEGPASIWRKGMPDVLYDLALKLGATEEKAEAMADIARRAQ